MPARSNFRTEGRRVLFGLIIQGIQFIMPEAYGFRARRKLPHYVHSQETVMKADAHLTAPVSFRLGLQPVDWYGSLLGWIFSPPANKIDNSSQA